MPKQKGLTFLYPTFCSILIGFSFFAFYNSPVQIRIELLSKNAPRDHPGEGVTLRDNAGAKARSDNVADDRDGAVAHGEPVRIQLHSKTPRLAAGAAAPETVSRRRPANHTGLNMITTHTTNSANNKTAFRVPRAYAAPSRGSKVPGGSCRTKKSLLNWRGDCVSSMDCPPNQFCYRRDGINVCRDTCKANSGSISLRSPLLSPREEDVWVVSYPKSGSTWVRHLITNIYRQSKFEKSVQSASKRKVRSKNGTLTLGTASPPEAATFDEVDRFIPFLEDKSLGPVRLQFLNKSLPRIFKSHQPYNCDPRPCNYFLGNQAKWQCECPNCAARFKRIIYIVRDGRAVMKSYYHFRSELNHIAPGSSFGAWLRRKRHYPGPTWADHVLSWHIRLKDFDPKDYLWLHYEAIVKDPSNTIKQLATFLGLPQLSKAGVRRVVEMSSREAMQKLEAKHGAGFFAKRYRKRHKSFRMVHNRSSWRDLYDKGSLEYFKRHNGAVMKCMGYQ